MYDVLAYGVIAPSRLVELEGAFPTEAGYGEITRTHPSLGGEAAACAYVLSRMGIATKLSGNRLGRDPESKRVLGLLEAAGVDCSAVATDAGDPVLEIVISGAGERTVLGSYGRMLTQQAWSTPSRDDIEAARIVCLDPFFGEASEQAARWCREASIPFVTVDVPPDSKIAHGAAVTIISEEFGLRSFAPYDPHSVISVYAHRSDLVILTRGSRPVLFSRGDAPVNGFTPFQVEARDTTGAGDSFRAGIIYGMLMGYDDHRLIATASAVAAMVSQRVPGVLNSPSVSELEQFLESTR